MHYSVGAIIKREGKILLIDRATPPYGFACVAGHIDEGEDKAQALRREILEESGLELEEHQLVAEEERDGNWCGRGIQSHYWYVFECQISGRIKAQKSEVRSIGWYRPEEIRQLTLEPVWLYWLTKLSIIKT